MTKDSETLKRMKFLIKAAKFYQHVNSELSSELVSEFFQLSEKKLIRMYEWLM